MATEDRIREIAQLRMLSRVMYTDLDGTAFDGAEEDMDWLHAEVKRLRAAAEMHLTDERPRAGRWILVKNFLGNDGLSYRARLWIASMEFRPGDCQWRYIDEPSEEPGTTEGGKSDG